jgi:hypothetical protein
MRNGPAIDLLREPQGQEVREPIVVEPWLGPPELGLKVSADGSKKCPPSNTLPGIPGPGVVEETLGEHQTEKKQSTAPRVAQSEAGARWKEQSTQDKR